MVKKIIKILGTVILTLTGIVLVLFLLFKYEMSWKITDVGLEESPDKRYSVLFQAVGEADWPFGYSHAKVTFKDGDRIIETFREDIADDGGQFRPDNYSVEWMKYGVVITFMGSEQPDRETEIFYDGRDSFAGYTDEEIEDILKDRYSIYMVEKITKDKNGYAIKADGIDFRADAKLALHDSYPQEVFKTVTDGLFPERFNRSVDWDVKEGENPSDLVYTPIISMNGPGSQDLNPYCDVICEWLDACFERLPYTEAKTMYDATGFIAAAPGYENVRLDFPDGRKYALVPIDRALGSSFYVLLSFNEKGNPDSAELINPDPFNQHGGEAKFITFLNDGNTGFAALSYSGGSEGLLFETLDGGKSFREITLPSPKIELPTGEFYNPFVMPEAAWEESDTIYLKISQGSDGDHHSEALDGARTVGIYASKDKGKTFEFIKEEAEDVSEEEDR